MNWSPKRFELQNHSYIRWKHNSQLTESYVNFRRKNENVYRSKPGPSVKDSMMADMVRQ